MSAPAVAPTQRPTSEDDDLIHVVCECEPDWALCGAFVADTPWYDEASGEVPCVVCADLDLIPCPRCGQ